MEDWCYYSKTMKFYILITKHVSVFLVQIGYFSRKANVICRNISRTHLQSNISSFLVTCQHKSDFNSDSCDGIFIVYHSVRYFFHQLMQLKFFLFCSLGLPQQCDTILVIFMLYCGHYHTKDETDFFWVTILEH